MADKPKPRGSAKKRATKSGRAKKQRSLVWFFKQLQTDPELRLRAGSDVAGLLADLDVDANPEQRDLLSTHDRLNWTRLLSGSGIVANLQVDTLSSHAPNYSDHVLQRTGLTEILKCSHEDCRAFFEGLSSVASGIPHGPAF